MAVQYSPSLPTTAVVRRPQHGLRALAIDLGVGAAALAVFLAPGRLHHAPATASTSFGGAVRAPVAAAHAPTARRASRARYVVERIPCAAGEGQLTCWTTAPAT